MLFPQLVHCFLIFLVYQEREVSCLFKKSIISIFLPQCKSWTFLLRFISSNLKFVHGFFSYE